MPAAEPVAKILPFKPAAVDQQALLSVSKISVASDCRTAELPGERIVVKCESARTYLIVTRPQWSALKEFKEGRTFPEVLLSLLETGRGIPLTELYELVVKACNRGILTAKGYPPPPKVPASRCRVTLSGSTAVALAAVSGLGAVAALFYRPPEPALTLVGASIAYVQVIFALSLGNFLGAAVAAQGGGVIYGAGWDWRSWLPRYRADIWDALMGGYPVLVNANLARLAPSFLMIAIAAFATPASVPYLLLAALFVSCPVFRTPGWGILNFLYGKPTDDAMRHFEFVANRNARTRLRAQWQNANWRYYCLQSGSTIVWLALVLLATALSVPREVVAFWDYLQHGRTMPIASVIVLGILGAVLVAAAAFLGYVAWLEVREWWRRRRPLRPQAGKPVAHQGELDNVAISEVFAQTTLFRNFSPADLATLANAAVAEEFKAGALVIREGDVGDRLYVVMSGSVRVEATGPSGHADFVTKLGPCSIFGEIALLTRSPRTRTVRMATKGVLLSLSRDAFEQIVLSRVSRQEVETAVQKASFIGRLHLARNWTPAVVEAFSRLCTIENFVTGQMLIKGGQMNQRFQIVYEGEVAVRRDDRVIARLGVGDFIGEIGILRNNVAHATVVAVTPGRVLWMDKGDFLRFVASDFTAGLYFEKLGTRRLGSQLLESRNPFPHTPSFEEYGA